MKNLLAPLLALALCAAAARAEVVLDEMAKALPRQKALVVQIGAATADLAIQCGKGGHVVLVVEPDRATVERLTAEFLQAGLSGRVRAEDSPVTVLPFVNNLANVVVVDDWKRMCAAGLTAAELLRVLAPGGLACLGQRNGEATAEQFQQWVGKIETKAARNVKQDGTWLFFRKIRPAGMDEWTHELHDPTRNPATQDQCLGIPQQVHWIAGTPYTWQIEHYRTAGNRVVIFYAGRRGMSRWATYKEDIEQVEALDAFNGLQLWKRPFPPPAKGFFPIVTGDRIILQAGEELCALDATSGEKVLSYTEAGLPYAGVVSDGVLMCVRDAWAKALDVQTGKLLWEKKPSQEVKWDAQKQLSGWMVYNPIVAGGRLLLPELYRKDDAAKVSSERIVGLDVKTGKQTWVFDDPAIAGHHKRWFAYNERLFFSVPAGFVSVPLAQDKPVWKIPVTPLERRFSVPDDYFATAGYFWAREGPRKGGYLVGEKADTTQPVAPKTWVAFDLETGKVARKVGYEPGIPGWRGRCYADLAGPRFIFSENNEFVDLATGKISNFRIMRGHCGWGPFFGNGFFYGTPTWCIFCYPALFGAIAASSEVPPPVPVSDDLRLEKGPAFSADANAAARTPSAPEDWPTYRQNSHRTSGTTASLPLPLRDEPLWKQTFGERITGAVVADGRVYLAVVNQGRICALDEKTGKLLWSASAGPRIDTPPTRFGDLLLFGSHDGCVYALRAADGVLAWRFRAAPDRRMMAASDRIESAWPLPGAALVHEGVLYVLAGRITGADGGMHMYALDPQTGAPKWHRTVARNTNPLLCTGGDPTSYYWIEPEGQLSNNHLVANGSVIRLPDQHFAWDFRADNGEQIVPDKRLGVSIATFNHEFPWLGYDRPAFAYLFGGADIHAEYRHPYESGTMMSYPNPTSVGLVCKRMRMKKYTEIIACTPDDAAKEWENKTRTNKPWKPVQLQDTDLHGLLTAGGTAFAAAMDFGAHPDKGRVVALSMKDGSTTQKLELPGLPAYDGMAVAHGKLFVSLQDGTILCFGAKP